MAKSKDKLYEALKSAVEEALNECGLELFKRTSMFMSNRSPDYGTSKS